MLDLLRSDTNVLGEALAVGVLIGVWALAVWGMYRAWRRRRDAEDAAFGPLPLAAAPTRAADGEALYTGTTWGDVPAQRVTVGGLFSRGRCVYWIDPAAAGVGADGGLVFTRERGPTVAVTAVRDIRLVGAHAGRVLAPGRIAVVEWTLNGRPVETGFGFPDAAHAATFAAAVAHASGLPADWHAPTPEHGPGRRPGPPPGRPPGRPKERQR